MVGYLDCAIYLSDFNNINFQPFQSEFLNFDSVGRRCPELLERKGQV
jgi:hypothetical protein